MGECKNYEQDRGFGFLIAEEGQLEVFFIIQDIIMMLLIA